MFMPARVPKSTPRRTQKVDKNGPPMTKKRPSDETNLDNPVKRQRDDREVLNSPTDSKCSMYQKALAKVLRERAVGSSATGMVKEKNTKSEPVDLARLPLRIPQRKNDNNIPPQAEEITPKRRQRRRAGKRVQRSLRKKLQDARMSEQAEDRDSDSFSPIQGYTLKVKNISSAVSEEDLVKLFSRIGAVRNVNSNDEGEAKVTYVKRACAVAAVDKYDGKDLDDQEIIVEPHTVRPVPTPIGYEWREKIRSKRPKERKESVGKIDVNLPVCALFNPSQSTANVEFNFDDFDELWNSSDDSDKNTMFEDPPVASRAPVEFAPTSTLYKSLIPKRK